MLSTTFAAHIVVGTAKGKVGKLILPTNLYYIVQPLPPPSGDFAFIQQTVSSRVYVRTNLFVKHKLLPNINIRYDEYVDPSVTFYRSFYILLGHEKICVGSKLNNSYSRYVEDRYKYSNYYSHYYNKLIKYKYVTLHFIEQHKHIAEKE